MNRPHHRHSPPSARVLALRALQAYEARGAFVTRVLDELFEQSQVDPCERRLATELAAETVRRQLTLDRILSVYVSRPRESVEDDLWRILRLGVCQLLCLPHVAVHAAVNETVSLCDFIRKTRGKAFVNGVLRNLERDIIERQSLTDVDAVTGDARTLPVVELRGTEMTVQAIRFARDVFTSPQRDDAQYISEVASLPLWLVDRWKNQFADPQRVWRTALWMTTPGQMTLRVNLLRTTRDQLISMLVATGVEASPGTLPEAINLKGSVSVTTLPGFSEGWFSVQDVSAMSAVDLLAPRAGERILDMCAAPGGKTAHLAERSGGQAHITACDISDPRLRMVDQTLERLQLTNVEVQQVHDHGEDLPEGPFDAILVDVPCSNTGVLGKRVEARWRLVPAAMLEMVPLQQRLLRDALQRTRPGGRVVYSTCSIDQAENREVVQALLQIHPAFRIAEERQHWPGFPGDGGYQCLLIHSGN